MIPIAKSVKITVFLEDAFRASLVTTDLDYTSFNPCSIPSIHSGHFILERHFPVEFSWLQVILGLIYMFGCAQEAIPVYKI